MGTRLYPNTEDRAVLAQLAGVTEATWERLEQFPRVKQRRGDEKVSG